MNWVLILKYGIGGAILHTPILFFLYFNSVANIIFPGLTDAKFTDIALYGISYAFVLLPTIAIAVFGICFMKAKEKKWIHGFLGMLIAASPSAIALFLL